MFRSNRVSQYNYNANSQKTLAYLASSFNWSRNRGRKLANESTTCFPPAFQDGHPRPANPGQELTDIGEKQQWLQQKMKY